jgi:RimK family alpha-L-glutamate ligase
VNTEPQILALNGGHETELALQIVSPKNRSIKSSSLSIEIAPSQIIIYEGAEELTFENSIVFNRYPVDSQFCGILLEHLTQNNVEILNPASLSFRKSTEKTAQMTRLANADIPVPHSFVVHKRSYEIILPLITNRLSFPMVVKADGIRGEKVALVHSQNEVDGFIEALPDSELIIFQEYIENQGDVRVICCLGKYVNAIYRRGESNTFLNNVAQGGTVEAYEPTTEEIALAEKASAINGFDLAGVDIIHTLQGPKVLEVNIGPGVNGFESIHGKHTVLQTLAKRAVQQYNKNL